MLRIIKTYLGNNYDFSKKYQKRYINSNIKVNNNLREKYPLPYPPIWWKENYEYNQKTKLIHKGKESHPSDEFVFALNSGELYKKLKILIEKNKN